MRLLIIGVTGFLGSALERHLARIGHDVVGASRSGRAGDQLDVADEPACCRVVARGRFDVVVNLAAGGVTAGSSSPTAMLDANAIGPGNVARACLKTHGETQLLHVASSTEPAPGAVAESEYSRSKAIGTNEVSHLATTAGLGLRVVRIHNCYGPGQPSGRFVADLIRSVKLGTPYTILHPDRVRDFCFLDDVVARMTELIEAPNGRLGSAVEIGTGVGTRLRDVATTALDCFGGDDESIAFPAASEPDPNRESIAGAGPDTLLRCSTSLCQGLTRIREGWPE